MSRAFARELSLVNWRGVFFERYLLDRNVTALEGDNGAGKTTVMIAAYLVLLPDLSRLRFTNLGETGATGGDKGIWGRLGDAARPSYAAMTLQLADNSSLIAGVIIRRKAEPTVQLDPFIIRGLPVLARARDYLLRTSDDHDEIPSVEEMKQQVHDAGATLEVFSTSKAYFTTLFDLGVSPLRLSSDEERGKYNDMLRTSMTGGISRVLTSELRSFVLKEQTGLGDTLGRMRQSLAACRRTRQEVTESRGLERQITGVFDAGLGMFDAAVLAAQKQAREHEQHLGETQAKLDAINADLLDQAAELTDAGARLDALRPLLQHTEERLQAARSELLRFERSQETRTRLAELQTELASAEQHLAELQTAHRHKTAERTAAKEARAQAHSAAVKSAQGLANLQQGLDELHHRAHAYRRTSEQLRAASAALGQADLSRADVPQALERAERAIESLDRSRTERARSAELLLANRRDYDAATQALAALGEALDTAGAKTLPAAAPDDDNVSVTDVGSERYTQARARLLRYDEAEREATQLARLEQEAARLQRQVQERKGAKDELGKLDLAGDELTGAGLHRLVASLDSTVRSNREAARQASWNAKTAARQVDDLRGEQQLWQQRKAQRQRLDAAAQRLVQYGVHPSQVLQELRDARSEIQQRSDALRVRCERLKTERDHALDQATQLETSNTAVEPELLRLRDAVGGELLGERFEELEPHAARFVEAQLGPLRSAIVVEDVSAAVEQLRTESHQLDDVWLVRAGVSVVNEDPPADLGQHLVVEHPFGARLSRVPDTATLGKVARERRAAALRKTAQARSKALEEEERELRQAATAMNDLDALLAGFDLWCLGDPARELERIEQELKEHEARVESERERAEAVAALADASTTRVEQLRPLLRFGPVLDGPDQSAALAQALSRVELAQRAQKIVDAARDAARSLRPLAEYLRLAPPSDETLAQWRAESRAQEQERDRLFTAVEALRDVLRTPQALDWRDAADALDEQSALAPQLNAQHRELEGLAEQAEAALEAAEVQWESATLALQQAQAERGALFAHVERLESELQALGYLSLDEAGTGDVRAACEALQQEVTKLQLEERELQTRIALLQERRSHLRQQHEAASVELAQAQRTAAPSRQAWDALRREVEGAGLAFPSQPEAYTRDLHASELWPEARGKKQLLLARLADSPDGVELSRRYEAQPERDSAESYLHLWREVRTWLLSRLPAQIADVAEPLVALQRLRDDLLTLENRLLQQEHDLRGSSEDVARAIDVQVRRATAQVRRINQYLTGIRFGSIHGIRIEMGRVEKMAQVLTALRDGSAQNLLFQSNLPFEEALEEIFQRYGGGRSGGQRILDYREYVDLQVEVQRKSDTAAWELANPTRVSTGEAIGVGAALMMVILTEWERDANLLRSRQVSGSLRFLFLDEANRLSKDNLAVLFDLCEALQLQLLIAAPEVAQAAGNTTYRLVRRVSEDGTEEVLVTGRRARVPGEEEGVEGERASTDSETGDAEMNESAMGTEQEPVVSGAETTTTARDKQQRLF